ncbi:MAG TPA: hypothetical protein VN765_02605 [Candidatus Acidoferrum sp.]|nr:hypothetical protein [Candidatus Acidoferrum sp.]
MSKSERPGASPQPSGEGATPFGVNEVRLNGRQWLAALAVLGVVALLASPLWKRLERFDTGPDYRLPYALSKDYWLYQRRMEQAALPDKVILLGDSVVWGEYVLPEGTLSHFLNQEAGVADRFINGGLNGVFPLAQEGLVTCYSKALRQQKLILHCNPLWMSSPKADLSAEKEERFNHSGLVPQFWPRIPCYKADANERLSAIVGREIGFLAWGEHLQDAYFGERSMPKWTLQDDGGSPPHYTNSCKNPFAQITFVVPGAPRDDPDRGPGSPRHKPWASAAEGETRFDWVPLEASLQWQAFRRVLEILRARGNDVMVMVGPFNEHIMAEDNRAAYRKTRDGMEAWLTENHVAHLTPETLPSGLYADDCHPLTEGYQLLAKRLYADPVFRQWLR